VLIRALRHLHGRAVVTREDVIHQRGIAMAARRIDCHPANGALVGSHAKHVRRAALVSQHAGSRGSPSRSATPPPPPTVRRASRVGVSRCQPHQSHRRSEPFDIPRYSAPQSAGARAVVKLGSRPTRLRPRLDGERPPGRREIQRCPPE
jgi:hypothetical protein